MEGDGVQRPRDERCPVVVDVHVGRFLIDRVVGEVSGADLGEPLRLGDTYPVMCVAV